VLLSRNPDSADAEPSLLFTLRKEPAVVNMMPHCPVNLDNERSCHALLLLHVPWPVLEAPERDDPRAIPEKLIRGRSATCIERVKMLEKFQQFAESDVSTDADAAFDDDLHDDDGIRIPRHVRAVVRAQVHQREILANQGDPDGRPYPGTDGLERPDELEPFEGYDEEEDEWAGPDDAFDPEEAVEAMPELCTSTHGVFKNVSDGARAYYSQCIKRWQYDATHKFEAENCATTDVEDILIANGQALYDADKTSRLEEFEKSLENFNDGQRATFEKIRSGLEGNDQLRMFLTGGGGAGKSYVINKAARYGRLLFGKTRRGSIGTVAVAAPTGNAAFNAGGRTWHSMLGKGTGRRLTPSKRTLSNSVLAKLRGRLAGLKFVIFDEVSMISLEDLYEIHVRLCEAKRTDPSDLNVPFGGIHVLFVGDFFQLPPVSGHALYTTETTVPDTGCAREGLRLWHALNGYSELVMNMRQEDADPLATFCYWSRLGVCKYPLLDKLNTRLM
jgi:hypothetical protein